MRAKHPAAEIATLEETAETAPRRQTAPNLEHLHQQLRFLLPLLRLLRVLLPASSPASGGGGGTISPPDRGSEATMKALDLSWCRAIISSATIRREPNSSECIRHSSASVMRDSDVCVGNPCAAIAAVGGPFCAAWRCSLSKASWRFAREASLNAWSRGSPDFGSRPRNGPRTCNEWQIEQHKPFHLRDTSRGSPRRCNPQPRQVMGADGGAATARASERGR